MLNIGDKAPEFKLMTANNPEEGKPLREFELSKALGEGSLIIAFFPASFTGICEQEMCSFRDNLKAFEEASCNVVGISVDMPFAQKKFAEINNISFPLLSDLGGKVSQKYGVYYDDFIGLSGVSKRSVFIINKNGEITYKWVTENPAIVPNYKEVIDSI